jgi:dihydroorotate dehydrogenase (NAD+) catalytic subunit
MTVTPPSASLTTAPQAAPGTAYDQGTTVAGLALANPVLTASGCAAAGRELGRLYDVAALGAVVTKSILRDARSGRPTPRMAETPSGMLNSIGLQGPGLGGFLARDLPWLREAGATTIVSIAGNDAAEFAELAGVLAGEPGVGAIEVNISCPNVANRGLVFACDAISAAEVVRGVVAAVRTATAATAATGARMPVLAKLSPDVTDLVAIARAVLDAGADGLSMINTTLGMVIDTDTLRPALAGVTGGLSGPAIRPIAVRCVWQVHAAMLAGELRPAPIVGIGGVATGRDAAELVLAGACAVQVGTATFHDPGAPLRVGRELADLLAARGFSRFGDAVGYAHRAAPGGPSGGPSFGGLRNAPAQTPNAVSRNLTL